MGTLSILNVSEGDIKISFDKENTAEKVRASRIIKDALRRGYALLIEVNGAYQRAVDFDAQVGEYIIADYDPMESNEQETTKTEEIQPPEIKTKTKSVRRKRLKMENANAVGVAPTAGG